MQTLIEATLEAIYYIDEWEECMCVCVTEGISNIEHSKDGWLFEFYVLATSKVMSEWVPICDSVQSW